MYRRASKADIDEILKIPNLNKSKDELERYLSKGYQYLYVYEKENNSIVGASFFGADDIDDDDYDSEVYGIYTRNVKDKDIINAEILFDTKKELFNLRFQNATNQLDNTSRIKEVRRNIARIQTVITEKGKE